MDMALTTLDEIVAERRETEAVADKAMKARPPMPVISVVDSVMCSVYEGGGQHRELCVSIQSSQTGMKVVTTVAAMDELVAEWLKLRPHLWPDEKFMDTRWNQLLAAMRRLASDEWLSPGEMSEAPTTEWVRLLGAEVDQRVGFAAAAVAAATSERSRTDEREEPAEQDGDAGIHP
jgi:hypothetical protein